MNHQTLLKPALIAGIAVGVLSALPVLGALNCFCCAWVIAGGVLAAFLSVRASPAAVTLGQGLGVGLLAGAVAAVVDTAFSIPVQIALTGMGMGVAEQMGEALEQVPNLPPEMRDMIRSIFVDGRGLGVIFLLLTGALKLVVYGLISMLGGAIGVALFEKRPPGADSRLPPATYQPPLNFPPPPPPPPENGVQ
ncbi:MAG: hypothetical protein ABIG68_02490 [Acidobacteriota bacterium]